MDLVVFPNCNPVKRYETWMDLGGRLQGQRGIGCGLNTLAFLEVLTRPDAETKVGELATIKKEKGPACKGTSFKELINFVYTHLETPRSIAEDVRSFGTPAELARILNTLEASLPANSCTIVKFNSKEDPEIGHTIVISKDANGTLLTIDPQWEKLRSREKTCSTTLPTPCAFDEKFFNAYHAYSQSVSLMVYGPEPRRGGKKTRRQQRKRRQQRRETTRRR
jgi:hypothetical protein